ncbi:uncharacterized protein LOC126323777 [Schistocerca gregaria]|uniref:uncharacterized protein LOC126323777 n=1 Tax=Schistocerca gregaria TaxID=7010 RepID=UPI00211DF5B7|nr:uncharacterized protein LOC126323777 [Schistocerca gregaria]
MSGDGSQERERRAQRCSDNVFQGIYNTLAPSFGIAQMTGEYGQERFAEDDGFTRAREGSGGVGKMFGQCGPTDDQPSFHGETTEDHSAPLLPSRQREAPNPSGYSADSYSSRELFNNAASQYRFISPYPGSAQAPVNSSAQSQEVPHKPQFDGRTANLLPASGHGLPSAKPLLVRRPNYVARSPVLDPSLLPRGQLDPNSYITSGAAKLPLLSLEAPCAKPRVARRPLSIISTREMFVLSMSEPSGVKPVLIERKNAYPGAYTRVDAVPAVSNPIAVYQAFGVLGIIALANEIGEIENYLILVTGVEAVGLLCGLPIYRIKQTEFITFHSQNESEYARLPKPPSSAMRAFCESGLFYWSPDYHLTHTQQRLAAVLAEQREKAPMWKTADRRFFWNRFLIRSFINKQMHEYVMVVIRGHVSICLQEIIVSREAGLGSSGPCTYLMALISRISCRRAGTRYNVRGIDDNGHVGNFVETEQILVADGRTMSFVQVRGSVPLFWEESLSKTGYVLFLSRAPESSAIAFEKHLNELLKLYYRVHLINLLSKRKKEQLISEAYEDQLLRWKGPSHSLVRYTYFNFHAECSKNYSKILNLLQIKEVSEDLQTFGYFCRDSSQLNPSKYQLGIFRTNCLDCLDRTNVTQAAFTRAILHRQLQDIGTPYFPVNINGLIAKLNEMWADNGDAISKAYTGTGAMKSSYTRKGRHTLAGLIDDGLKSVTRFYINTFKDNDNQVSIDLFLGKIEELAENEQAPIEDLWVRERRLDRMDEYVRRFQHKLFIVTYNCNARIPDFFGDSDQLNRMLDPVVCSLEDVSIWVLGFQEIVELSAQQMLWNNRSDTLKWEAMLTNHLNHLRPKSKVVLLRSVQLVGIHLCVFVSSDQLAYFSEAHAQTVKVGLKGVAGNKGAACLSFSFHDTTFCFVCAHLTAGQKEYNDRVSDYHTINTELKFGINKAHGRSIADYDNVFWLGDLNWRIDLPYAEVMRHIQAQNWPLLYEYDQLYRARREEVAFADLEETPINWAPTYKYDPVTKAYDTSEPRRTPAWTDRILWRATGPQSTKNLLYTRSELLQSDHCPVKGLFLVEVKSIDKKKYTEIKNQLFREAADRDASVLRAEINSMRLKRRLETQTPTGLFFAERPEGVATGCSSALDDKSRLFGKDDANRHQSDLGVTGSHTELDARSRSDQDVLSHLAYQAPPSMSLDRMTSSRRTTLPEQVDRHSDRPHSPPPMGDEVELTPSQLFSALASVSSLPMPRSHASQQEIANSRTLGESSSSFSASLSNQEPNQTHRPSHQNSTEPGQAVPPLPSKDPRLSANLRRFANTAD